MCRLLPQNSTNEFAKSGLDLILNASQDYAKMSLDHLKGQLMDTIMDTRKSLVAPPRTSEPGDTMLNELNAKVLTEITEQIRGKNSYGTQAYKGLKSKSQFHICVSSKNTTDFLKI